MGSQVPAVMTEVILKNKHSPCTCDWVKGLAAAGVALMWPQVALDVHSWCPRLFVNGVPTGVVFTEAVYCMGGSQLSCLMGRRVSILVYLLVYSLSCAQTWGMLAWLGLLA